VDPYPIDKKTNTMPVRQDTDPRFLSYDKDYIVQLINDPSIKQNLTIALEFSQSDYNRFVVPILTFVAHQTLKLPASQYHHHAYPGALFMHLIEVGTLSASYAKADPSMQFNVKYELRELYGQIIPFAAFIAGILHDIAKPVTDYFVLAYDKNGTVINIKPWRPIEESLTHYLEKNNATYYKAFFNTDREYDAHQRHSLFFMNPIIGLLSEYPHKEILRDIISTKDCKDKPLLKNIKRADSTSTSKDLQRVGQQPLLMDQSNFFLQHLNNFDFTNRILSNDHRYQKSYLLSEKAIHIFYPVGLKNIMTSIQHIYGDKTALGFSLPTSPARWLMHLGVTSRILNRDYSNQHSPDPDFPDIAPFIHELYVEFPSIDGTAAQPIQTTFITISRSLLALTQLQPNHLVNVYQPNESDKAPEHPQMDLLLIDEEPNESDHERPPKKPAKVTRKKTTKEQPENPITPPAKRKLATRKASVESNTVEDVKPEPDNTTDTQKPQQVTDSEVVSMPTKEPVIKAKVAVADEDKPPPKKLKQITVGKGKPKPRPRPTRTINDGMKKDLKSNIESLLQNKAMLPESNSGEPDTPISRNPELQNQSDDAQHSTSAQITKLAKQQSSKGMLGLYDKHEILQDQPMLYLFLVTVELSLQESADNFTANEQLKFTLTKHNTLCFFEAKFVGSHFSDRLMSLGMTKPDAQQCAQAITHLLKLKHNRTFLFSPKKQDGYVVFKKIISNILVKHIIHHINEEISNE
jgi:hypothetical protein